MRYQTERVDLERERGPAHANGTSEGGRMQTRGKGEGRADTCKLGGKGEGVLMHVNRGAHKREGGANREREDQHKESSRSEGRRP